MLLKYIPLLLLVQVRKAQHSHLGSHN